jgi:hypothetical protein
MRFNIAAVVSALVVMVTASTIPHSHVEMDISLRPRGPLLEARDTYDCAGSSLCQSLQVRACDDAVNNKLIRNDVVNYGASGYVT